MAADSTQPHRNSAGTANPCHPPGAGCGGGGAAVHRCGGPDRPHRRLLREVPFHAVARLLLAATGVDGLDPHAARARIRAQASDAETEDLVLFDDLLGIADPEMALPRIDPDARRRRLTALVNAAVLARETRALYIIEDAHWIDEVSESMLAEFLMVIPQTPSLVLVTYRPEYRGPLIQLPGAQTVALAPLSDSETAALVSQLLGPDPPFASGVRRSSIGPPYSFFR